MTPSLATTRNPWAWVPSLYFAQGIPFVMVNTVSVIMYKRMGISNTDIAFYTSWLNLPWMIKPLWSPFVDLFGTKRLWTVALQAVVGVLLACVAFTLPMPKFFQYTIAIFWIMAFSSATHDIAADGFYMLGLKEHQQAAFAGVRSTCFRLATITGEGLLVIVAGRLEIWNGGNIAAAWRVTIAIIAVIMLSAAAYHKWILPHPETDAVKRSGQGAIAKEFGLVFAEFFKKKNIGTALAFLLCYRLAEAQLLKMIYPFLLDPRAEGGLGLTTSEVGFIKGTIGVIALLGGGLLGGWLISRNGLRAWLWPMVVIMHLPDLAFVYLAYARPESTLLISAAVAVEQFGYGFGFTAYMLFMIFLAEGNHKTAHYAICTGFMAMGVMVPGMFSGWLQEKLGYQHFFIWVLLSTIPGFLVAALVKIPADFGRKKQTA